MPQLYPVSRWHMLLVMASVLILPGLASRPARAQDEPPVYLQGNPIVQADRIQLIREEARERQREIKEARERAKEIRELARHPQKAKGQHAEQRPGDEDVTPASVGAARAAEFNSALNTMVAPLNTRANSKLGD